MVIAVVVALIPRVTDKEGANSVKKIKGRQEIFNKFILRSSYSTESYFAKAVDKHITMLKTIKYYEGCEVIVKRSKRGARILAYR